jgi:hypothetical protein
MLYPKLLVLKDLLCIRQHRRRRQPNSLNLPQRRLLRLHQQRQGIALKLHQVEQSTLMYYKTLLIRFDY